MKSRSLAENLRYRVRNPLRYTQDLLHARKTHKPSEIRRILIASDNLVSTSEQQFAPLFAHGRLIANQFGIAFDQRLLADVLATRSERLTKYAAVIVKQSFMTPALTALNTVASLRRLLPSSVRLLYFDGDDDVCVQWGEILDNVDLYVKKHVFADPSLYHRRFIGKSNLTDYVARVYGRSFSDNVIPNSGTVTDSLLPKIAVGYNIALDDKITHLARTTRPTQQRDKTVDVICRAACAPDHWIYPLRGSINQALEPLMRKGHSVLLPNQRVDQQVYYDEMRRSRICISPFGFGEICWRDFEAVLMGCLLVKPDMSHIRTEPDIFVPGETYVPVQWDFSDLAATCERYLADPEAVSRITANAYEVLSSYYERYEVLGCLHRLLAQAGVLHSAPQDCDNLAEDRS